MMFFTVAAIVALIGVFMLLASKKVAKKNFTLLAVAVLLIGAFASVGSCVISVPTGHTGVVTTFGKVEDYTFEAGIHLKAPFSDVINMDNRTQKGTLDMSCFSSDIQEVTTVYTINYRIEKKNAQTIYKTIGKNYYDTVVTPCITNSMKTVAAKYNAEDLIGSRQELAKQVEDLLSKKLRQYNIELVSTAIEDFDFTDAFTTAVEEKQVAAQNKLKAETQADQKVIEAEANAKAKLIAAEAEAKANATISKSLNGNILYQQWLEKWDGILPKVAGSDSSVILNELSGEEAVKEATK